MYILMQSPWTFQTMLGSHRTLLCQPRGLSIRTKLAANPGIPLVVLETLPSLLSYRCSLMRSQGPTSSPTYTLASGRHFVNPNQFIERVCITEGIRIIHTELYRLKENQSVWFKPYSLFYSVLSATKRFSDSWFVSDWSQVYSCLNYISSGAELHFPGAPRAVGPSKALCRLCLIVYCVHFK